MKYFEYLSEDEQKNVFAVMKDKDIGSVDLKSAKALREVSKLGEMTENETIEKTLTGSADIPADSVRRKSDCKITLPVDVFEKYFADVPRKDVDGVVLKALEYYFENIAEK